MPARAHSQTVHGPVGLGVSDRTSLTKPAAGRGWPVGYNLPTFVAGHGLDQESGQLVGSLFSCGRALDCPGGGVTASANRKRVHKNRRRAGFCPRAWLVDPGHAQRRQVLLPLTWHQGPGWARGHRWPCRGLRPLPVIRSRPRGPAGPPAAADQALHINVSCRDRRPRAGLRPECCRSEAPDKAQ